MQHQESSRSVIAQHLTKRISYKWLVLGTTSMGVILSTMDASAVSLSYPALAATFSTDPSTVVWVGIIYFLFSTGLLLTLGWLGDSLGRNRLYTGGMIVFTLGLGLSASAASIHQLIAYRAIQGIGSAMILATGNALLVAAFPSHQRGTALGLQGIAIGLGLGIGPLISGFLLDVLDWRAVFYVRVPVGLLGLLLAGTLLDRERPRGPLQADYTGALVLFGCLTAFTLAINQAGRLGPLHAVVLGAAVIAVALFPLFLRIERRVSRPILDLSLFRNRVYRGGLLSLILTSQSWATIALLTPFLMINAMEFPPFRAGLFLTAFAIIRLVFSPAAGWLADRLGTRLLTTTGLLLVVGGLVFISRLDADSSSALLLWGLLIAGVGNALFEPPNTSAIMGSVPGDRLGTAAASLATARQVGLIVGIALGGALFAARSAAYAGISAAQVAPERLAPAALASGVSDALVAAAALCFLGVFFALAREGRAPRQRQRPQ